MGNLYEHTNTMLYVRDLLFVLEPENAVEKQSLSEKLVEFPEKSNLVDDYPIEPRKPASKIKPKLKNNSSK